MADRLLEAIRAAAVALLRSMGLPINGIRNVGPAPKAEPRLPTPPSLHISEWK
jgi:hypothetical protein